MPVTAVGDSGVVTPEAVRLDFDEATVGSRAAAIAIDWAIQFAALVVVSMAGGLLMAGIGPGLPGWVGFTIVTLLSFLVLFGYPIAFETLMRGRSPGKMALGLRVVTVEGAPVGFRHAAIRALFGLVDFLMTSGSVAVITALVSRRQQRLGDHVAGTVVVRERTGAGTAEATTFTVPQGFEAYAESIDPAGLREEDYRALRAFLLRATTLEPDRRASLAQRLAASIAARLAHPIPPGVSPEVFLRCVAARHQARGRPAQARQTFAQTPPPGTEDEPSGGFAAPG